MKSKNPHAKGLHMFFPHKKMMIFSIFLMPMTGLSTEKSTQTAPELLGYYDFNIGDYSNPAVHHYLPKEGAGTIETKVGDVFTVSFPSSPSSGFSWALRTLPTELLLLDSSYNKSKKCNDGIPGCGGFTTYTFKSLQKGIGIAVFQYGRRWENGGSVKKTIKMIIR